MHRNYSLALFFIISSTWGSLFENELIFFYKYVEIEENEIAKIKIANLPGKMCKGVKILLQLKFLPIG